MRERSFNEPGTAWAGRSRQSFAVLDSTNEYAKQLAAGQSVHGLLVTADAQSAGKGRRGRVWQSPDAENIYMTLCLEPEFAAERAAGLTLVMALAVSEAVCEVTGVKPGIKWPNDLVMNQKKICGILTELIPFADHYAVLIGVGLNVNTTKFPEELIGTAGSLKTELGKAFSRERLIAAVLKHFEAFYAQYEKTGDLSLLKGRYEDALVNLGKAVRVLDPKGAYEGTAVGIMVSGGLLVRDSAGTEHLVDSGEVSVRGLFGYV